MTTYLDPRRVENELILQQRDIRYIRAANKAIAMMNEKGEWGYDSGRKHDLILEVWRWDNLVSGFTVRFYDTRQPRLKHLVLEDVRIHFYDSGEIETSTDWR